MNTSDSEDAGTRLYWHAVRQAMAFQLLFVVLSALVMDRGDTVRITGVALVGFWTAALFMFLRRPKTPTATDLSLLAWGFLPLVIVVQVTTRLVWTWRGLPH